MCLGAVSRYGTSNDLPSFPAGPSARSGEARHSTASAAHDNPVFMNGLPELEATRPDYTRADGERCQEASNSAPGRLVRPGPFVAPWLWRSRVGCIRCGMGSGRAG